MCRSFLLLAMLVMMIGCTPVPGESSVRPQSEEEVFPLPRIPMILRNPQERMTYILLHYWDNVNFESHVLGIENEMLEQGFVDYLSIFRYVDAAVLPQAVENLVAQSVVTMGRVAPLMALASKYLYHPESPMLNEEHYRIFVETMMKRGDKMEVADQERLRMELAVMDKNRVGTRAADFSFVTPCGSEGSLYEVGGPMTLLMFYDPHCESCWQVLSEMQRSAVLAHKIANCQLRLLTVCVAEETIGWRCAADLPSSWINGVLLDEAGFDEEYVLRAYPTLFLLDADKSVLIKEMPFVGIEHRLSKLFE